MKLKVLFSGLTALALSAWTVNACLVYGTVLCPNGTTAAGIGITVTAGNTVFGATTTDGKGIYAIELPTLPPGNYQVCVDPGTLPTGFTKVSGCQKITVPVGGLWAEADFILDGPACEPPPPPGLCWLTGGGEIGKTKGVADFSYGGVVNPGCSPDAAEGGNWNVVNHLEELHFQGQAITVDACGGVPTKSPRVNVNTIDFHGTGIITGIGDNPTLKTDVCFVGHAEDWAESGSGKDLLYLYVYDCASGATRMLISTDTANPLNVAPVAISTGNLQIHTTGCSK
jgi:hypothetical protein